MAFTGITATEAEIDQKSGANVSSSYTDTMKTQALLQAESSLNAETEYNWSDAFAALNADVKSIVTAITSAIVAIEAIRYDMDAVGRGVASAMINSLSNEIRENKRILLEKNKQQFVKDA